LISKRNIIWLCILLCISKVHSQSFYESYKNLTAPTQEEVDSIIKRATNTHANEAAKIAREFSIKIFNRKDYSSAIHFAHQEVTILHQSHSLSNTYSLSLALYRLGIFQYKNKEYLEAIKTYKKIISLKINDIDVAKSYCEIGRSYNKLLDYYKAIEYYEIGITKLEKLEEYSDIIGKYNNFSIVYTKLGTKEGYLKSIEILKKAEQLQHLINFTDRNLYSLNNGLAANYSRKSIFDFDKASFYYQKNLKRSLLLNDSIITSTTYFNLSEIHNIKKDKKALFYINKGFDYSTTIDTKGQGFHLMADYYRNLKELDTAISFIEKSITTYANDPAKNDNTLTYLIQSPYKDELLKAITKKVDLLIDLYSLNSERYYIEEALQTISLADQFIDAIQNESFETASLFHWRTIASTLYTKGVYCSNILTNNKRSFYFTEKNKALLLTQAILKNTHSVEVPKEVTHKENTITKEILNLENQITKNSISVENVQKLKKELFDKKNIKQQFMDSIQPLYPSYFTATSNSKIYPLHKVQEQLHNNTAIVSYIWNKAIDTDHNFYGVLTTKSDIIAFEITKEETIKTLIKDYQEKISKPLETKEDIKQFQEIAYQLYTALFPTQEIQQRIKNKHLIIIPDGDLQNIPFEALITKEKTNEYLIKSNEVSYAYSVSSLLYNSESQRQSTNNFTGFAPTTFKNVGLDSIPLTTKELKTINALEKGSIYFREEATKSKFLNTIGDTKIMHLATHADAGQQPWIAFHDNKLELHELYTLKNQAELVVLSGCNTSIGTSIQGEGVLSLARGFFYGGTNTVVSSLWNSNDKSTALLFEQFYKNLTKGQTRSASLRQAKLDYLDSHSLSQASPYYWASFVLMGNTDSLPQKERNTMLYVIIGVIILLLFLFLHWRKQKISLLTNTNN